MADSVYVSIASRFAGSAPLQTAMPGGLWPGRARADALSPRGTYNLISMPVTQATEGDNYHEATRVQFDVYGSTVATTDAAIRELCAGVDGFDRLEAVATGDGAIVTACRVMGPIGPILEEDEGPGGSRVWRSTADYIFHVSRRL